MHITNTKIQDPISNRSWPYAKRNGRTHTQTQTNMPLEGQKNDEK